MGVSISVKVKATISLSVSLRLSRRAGLGLWVALRSGYEPFLKWFLGALQSFFRRQLLRELVGE